VVRRDRALIGKEIGIPDLKWVRSANDFNGCVWRDGFTNGAADDYVEMFTALDKGVLFEDYSPEKHSAWAHRSRRCEAVASLSLIESFAPAQPGKIPSVQPPIGSWRCFMETINDQVSVFSQQAKRPF